MTTQRPWVAVLLVQITLSGCASLVKLPESTDDVEGQLPIQAYAQVLHKYVNDRGEVDFPALQRDRADLGRYVVYITRTPASAFSHPRERLGQLSASRPGADPPHHSPAPHREDSETALNFLSFARRV